MYKFTIGDLIHNEKDNLLFLVINVSKEHLELEYYDNFSTVRPKDTYKVATVGKKYVINQIQMAETIIKHYKVNK
jgi:hypothetical protein